MEDTLYTALKYIAPRRVRYLPFGAHIAFDKAIYYHFYHVPLDAEMRLASARWQLEKRAITKLEGNDARRLVDALLLSLIKGQSETRQIIQQEKEHEVVEHAIRSGRLNPALRTVFERDDFPFKQSPLVGKSIIEIAKSSTATAVFIVVVAGENAPVAILLTPVGIIAIHVANRVKGRIAKKVDDMLRDLLK